MLEERVTESPFERVQSMASDLGEALAEVVEANSVEALIAQVNPASLTAADIEVYVRLRGAVTVTLTHDDLMYDTPAALLDRLKQLAAGVTADALQSVHYATAQLVNDGADRAADASQSEIAGQLEIPIEEVISGGPVS